MLYAVLKPVLPVSSHSTCAHVWMTIKLFWLVYVMAATLFPSWIARLQPGSLAKVEEWGETEQENAVSQQGLNIWVCFWVENFYLDRLLLTTFIFLCISLFLKGCGCYYTSVSGLKAHLGLCTLVRNDCVYNNTRTFVLIHKALRTSLP